jgi:hypothetical protein
MKKFVLEAKARDQFDRQFSAGHFGAQRYGQAFYDFFKLDRMAKQEDLKNLYAKDGEHARRLINELFEFN